MLIQIESPPKRFYDAGVEKQIGLFEKELNGDIYPTLTSAAKLGGHGVKMAWGVSAGHLFSCIGATGICEAGCYARNAFHLYTTVQKSMARNWLWILQWEKEGEIHTPAKELVQLIQTRSMRLYESGDFHSNYAVLLWAEVVRLLPDVKFWAYTRSFQLDFVPLLVHSNMMLWASADQQNKRRARKFCKKYSDYGVKLAWGPWSRDDRRRHNIGTGSEIPQNSFVCPTTNGRMDTEAACIKCQLCIHRGRAPRSVVFFKH